MDDVTPVVAALKKSGFPLQTRSEHEITARFDAAALASRGGGLMSRRSRLAVLGVLCRTLAACAGPVGTTRADPTVVLRDLARNATTTGEPSWPTRNVLFEHGLFGEFSERPEAVIAELHKAMKVAPGGPNQLLLFALAELSYLHGEATASLEYRLAAAVYAYAFLFPEGYGVTAGRFDPRGPGDRCGLRDLRIGIEQNVPVPLREIDFRHVGSELIIIGRLPVNLRDPGQHQQSIRRIWTGDLHGQRLRALHFRNGQHDRPIPSASRSRLGARSPDWG